MLSESAGLDCSAMSTTSFALYKKPHYIVDAAKIKYGRHVFVLGASQQSVDTFWQHVGYAVYPDTAISPPKEKGRTVVDIDSKVHINDSIKEMEGDVQKPHEQKKPADWYDDFQITSKKSKGESRSKSYSLEIGKTTEKQFGGNLKIGSSGFFNVVGGGISPELGINANYSKISSKSEKTEESRDEKLVQEYEVVDTLKVPPQMKVKVTITTWAVTYEADVKIQLTVDAKSGIPVKYRTPVSRIFGGFIVSSGLLTAKEIFAQEEDFEDDGVNITFSRMSKMSYLGEEVEIIKEEEPSN